MMKTIVEDGKRYVINDEGIITEAAVEEISKEEDVVEAQPLSRGDRVEVEGRLGEVITHDPYGLYGPTFGIRFDDGDHGAYLEDVISKTEVEKVQYDTPISQLKADWEEYQKLPGITADEIDEKSAILTHTNAHIKWQEMIPRLRVETSPPRGDIQTESGLPIVDLPIRPGLA